MISLTLHQKMTDAEKTAAIELLLGGLNMGQKSLSIALLQGFPITREVYRILLTKGLIFLERPVIYI